MAERDSRISVPIAEASGEIWFHSANRLWLTVDAWDGPLMPAGAPDGSASTAIAATYDLADAEYEGLGRKWREWWS